MPDPLEDAPLISAFIMFEPRCLACVTKKTGIPAARARRALARIARHLTVVETVGSCTSCGRSKAVVKVGE
jgi:hypothetical protein